MGKVLFVVGTLLTAVLVAMMMLAYVYNRWFWYEPPSPRKLEACLEEGLEYRWYVPNHRYVCADNRTFPGFHGL